VNTSGSAPRAFAAGLLATLLASRRPMAPESKAANVGSGFLETRLVLQRPLDGILERRRRTNAAQLYKDGPPCSPSSASHLKSSLLASVGIKFSSPSDPRAPSTPDTNAPPSPWLP
jgi:hypothetical protein